MAKIFLTTTCKVADFNPLALRNFELIVNLSNLDLQKQHHVVDCPAEADLVLFVCDRRIYHSGIYASEIFKKYRDKSLVIDFVDRTIPRLPGLYATIPSYLQQYPIYEYLFYPYNYGCFDLDKAVALFSEYKYLFSFMGNVNTHVIRNKILNLNHPKAYLVDTSKSASVDLFSEILIDSKFVLCPRGAAPSTIRVFEAMRSGRVPVIISDEWRENQIEGRWEDFSVRISEKDIELIPDILEKLEPQAIEMGREARIAWEKNFSIDNGFHWFVETCLRIQKSRSDFERISSRNIYLEAFGTTHFIPLFKETIRRVTGKI